MPPAFTRPTRTAHCNLEFEVHAQGCGYRRVAGLDEVGRGALFGPVCAAAVIMNPQRIPPGINDSKSLSPRRRLKLAHEIRETAEASAVAFVDSFTIDRINILEATRRAMLLAVEKLETRPDFLLCDGDMVVPVPLPQQPIVGGDRRSLSIAAASILAKVARDHLIVNLDARYPGYDLRNNMGYGTRKHRDALTRLGPTPLHRASFRGVCGLDSVDSGPGVVPIDPKCG
ncbi:MAG: ribonuclease HII [Acidobacteriota bacterium]|nr:ribonuclease HII [Acidobacteriota bacterium]